MRRLALIAVAIAGVAGCAGLTVRPVADDEADKEQRGFRYYQASPYILVHTDNQGGLTTKLLYLPDPTKKMSAKPWNRLASNDTTLEFQNGVLTHASSDVDATTVPEVLIGALEKAAVAIAKAARTSEAQDETKAAPPYLYKVVIEKGKVKLLGGQAVGPDGKVEPIKVTVATLKQ